jgi:hypothetical protein
MRETVMILNKTNGGVMLNTFSQLSYSRNAPGLCANPSSFCCFPILEHFSPHKSPIGSNHHQGPTIPSSHLIDRLCMDFHQLI